jgi:hypothetical protein
MTPVRPVHFVAPNEEGAMQLHPLALGTITAAAMFFTACQHHDDWSGARTAETQLQAGAAPMAHACPMSVPGTTANAIDVPSGVVVEFTTTGGANDIAELRRRVHAMAEAGTLGMMRGPGSGAGRAGRAMAREASGTPRPRVRVEDTARGARVTLEPVDAQGLDALRARVRAHVPRMASNEACVRARSSP